MPRVEETKGPVISRRLFMAASLSSPFLIRATDTALAEEESPARPRSRFLFTSRGKTGLATSDGSKLKYLNFAAPEQVTWQPSSCFSDGHRIVVLSMEARRDGPGKPFDEYYTQTPTHLWQYDLDTEQLREICTQDRKAPFTTPELLISDDRILIQVVKNKVGQIYSVKLDGSDAREFTKAGEGLPYGLSLSPDGKRVAFHLASPAGYQVWTSDTDGSNRTKVAAEPGHLYFGTRWSPDGNWVLYVDCLHQQDPGHDWADVCIGRADGSEHRVLTTGQSMWFAATYGSASNRGGGSNVPNWTRDGQILFPRRQPGSKVPWQYRVGQPDLDHFNRDFRPDASVGYTQICRLNPADGSITELTPAQNQTWDFRGAQSSDGQQIVFCRATTGEAPGIWVMNSDGSNPRLITKGVDDQGADHPRWLPVV